MILYAESSAIVGWLFGELAAPAVREELAGAERVLASDLTLIESDRAILRAVVARRVPEGPANDLRARLAYAARRWTLFGLEPEIVERARRAFPGEPLRTLDAIHLASALAARSAIAGVALLSLDQRVRAAGAGLGFRVVPA